jgi:hypothetical protein
MAAIGGEPDAAQKSPIRQSLTHSGLSSQVRSACGNAAKTCTRHPLRPLWLVGAVAATVLRGFLYYSLAVVMMCESP